mgnify:CR=1 FL=1
MNDLMGMLSAAYDRHVEEQQARQAGNDRPVEDFVTFCREYLRQNQPVSMEFLASSLSLRFQDGTVVPFVADASDGTQVSGIQGGVEITKPDRREKPLPGALAFGITNGR